jgi:hypothetical protein
MTRIRQLLVGITKSDKKKGLEGLTLGEEDAYCIYQRQSTRCAGTADAMTCVPEKAEFFQVVVVVLCM